MQYSCVCSICCYVDRRTHASGRNCILVLWTSVLRFIETIQTSEYMNYEVNALLSSVSVGLCLSKNSYVWYSWPTTYIYIVKCIPNSELAVILELGMLMKEKRSGLSSGSETDRNRGTGAIPFKAPGISYEKLLQAFMRLKQLLILDVGLKAGLVIW